MSISQAFNDAERDMQLASKEGDADKAAILYRAASKNYTAAGHPTNSAIAIHNIAEKMIAAEKLSEAIDALVEAEVAGFNGPELAKNYQAAIAAYYNKGVKHLTAEEFVDAEATFNALFAKNLPADKFELTLKLNTFCQLVTSLEGQNKPIPDAILTDAEAVFLAIAPATKQVAQEVYANFIYVRLEAKYLKEGKHAEALRLFAEEEAVIAGSTIANATALKNLAFYQYDNLDIKAGLHILWSLYDAFGTSVEPLLKEVGQHAKLQANARLKTLDLDTNPGAEALVEHLVGDTITHAEIDAFLFA